MFQHGGDELRPNVEGSEQRRVHRRVTTTAAIGLATLVFALGACVQSGGQGTANPRTNDLKGVACVVGTFVAVVNAVWDTPLVVTAATYIAKKYGCPSSTVPSPDINYYAQGCLPAQGIYNTCEDARTNANIQQWISSPRALNGVVNGRADPDQYLTCITIIGQNGMDDPAAAENQNGCVLGNYYPPPPPPPPSIPTGYIGAVSVCNGAGTTGSLLNVTQYFPSGYTSHASPSSDANIEIMWVAGVPWYVTRTDLCAGATLPIVSSSYSGPGFVCNPTGTLGNFLGVKKFFGYNYPAGTWADIHPWPQDPSYVLLYETGTPYVTPRADICVRL